MRTSEPAPKATPAPVVALAKLREPFPAHQISKRPKETRSQADQRKKEQDAGNWPPKCALCDGFHHPRAAHLDYVGHAALTDRLLDVDPLWSWEPVAFTPEGLPAFDRVGGLWIKLNVCGVTRIGYGNAEGKSGGDAVKEIIGDALRNAAMRFGAALDLWHKGDLHAPDGTTEADARPDGKALAGAARAAIDIAETMAELDAWKLLNADFLKELSESDPDAYSAIVAHWKARAKAVRDRTPPASKAAFPGDFGNSAIEAGERLNGRAA